MQEFKNFLINHLFNNYGKYYDSYDEFKIHFDAGEVKISVADINDLVDQYNDSIPHKNCNLCGRLQVLIRGKYPKSEERFVCPTCTYERLETINEMSSYNYGIAKINFPSIRDVEGHKIDDTIT